MRITILITILFGLIIISCSSPESKEIPTAKILQSELDTFNWGDKFVTVEKISKTDFDKLNPNVKLDTSESANLLKDSSRVERKGDTLFFTVSDHKIVTLINITDTLDGEGNSIYSYLGSLDDIGQYIVSGSYYEAWDNVLVDQKTGAITHVCGEPIISPDKKYFICGNSDLQAGFTFNGIELYKNSHKPVLINNRELVKWGPEQIRWFDNNTLLIESDIVDTTLEDYLRTDYLKLTWK